MSRTGNRAWFASSYALAVAVLAGCGTPAAATPLIPAPPAGDSGTTVTSVVLRNGVRCAVMDGPQSKALVCDWGKPGAPTGVDPHGDRGTTITVVTLADGTECAVMDGNPGKALSCEGRA